jgi:nicotinate-nucleotide--dimethylbenzimidazole phosphoribosyltransferase
LIQNNLSPKLSNKSLFVFAADHGIAEEGVSAFPQDVTRQMVNNFLNQGAAINVLCNYHRIRLSIIDAGVKGKPIQNDALINMRIAEGTKNFALQRAMTLEQAQQSINVGIEVFKSQQAKEAIDIIGLGEMGIANTSSATAIISAITGKTVKECTWRGTGIDDQGLKHKIEVIEKALNYHLPDRNDGLEILSKVGGFEIGAMAGVALSAAAEKCVIVLDGLISTAAGLLAYTINPDIADYFIAGHKSVEKGHNFALEHMGLTPLLDLNMRLGEGTGAALTIDLSDAACHIMREMASFDDAGVSNKSEKLS